MLEEEWLVSNDPVVLLVALPPGRWSKRKFRLWATAAVRQIVNHWDGFGKFYHAALDVHLRYADDPVARSELIAIRRRVADEKREFDRWHHDEFPRLYSCNREAVWLTLDPYAIDPGAVLAQIRESQRNIFERNEWAVADASLCHLIREAFGNPFRPVTFSSEWRTDTAVALATHMFESRDFGAMPILADAFQDAGCDSDDILNHCRADALHVRGCWVVDLVLGKT